MYVRNLSKFYMALLFKNSCTYHRKNVRLFCTSTSESRIFCEISRPIDRKNNKVTVVGVGFLGTACAFNLLNQGISDCVILMDSNENKMKGEMLDIRDGAWFLKSFNIDISSNYEKTAKSKVCIIATGVPNNPRNSKLSIAGSNIEILKEVVPKLIDYSPCATLIVCSSPVDILTWAAWKLSGLSFRQVIGSGTNSDTVRFRYLISKRLGVPAHDVHGYVIGEHGQRLIPLWSSVTVGGVRLLDLNPNAGREDDVENWREIPMFVRNEPVLTEHYKGHTCWAEALSIGKIVRTILNNESDIHAVTTNIKGFYGIDSEVFLSLPCVLNANGLHKISRLNLADNEKKQLLHTAAIHQKLIKAFNL